MSRRGGCLIVLVILAALVVSCFLYCSRPGIRKVEMSAVSPDGRLVAYSVFDAGTSFAQPGIFDVIVHRAGSPFDVYNEQDFIWSSESTPPLRLEWLNATTVRVVVGRDRFQRNADSIVVRTVAGVTATTEVLLDDKHRFSLGH